MRENRLSGSEGGGATSSPYPYQGFSLLAGGASSAMTDSAEFPKEWSRDGARKGE